MDAATVTVVKDGGFFGHPQSDLAYHNFDPGRTSGPVGKGKHRVDFTSAAADDRYPPVADSRALVRLTDPRTARSPHHEDLRRAEAVLASKVQSGEARIVNGKDGLRSIILLR